jgi:hypothetical protein
MLHLSVHVDLLKRQLTVNTLFDVILYRTVLRGSIGHFISSWQLVEVAHLIYCIRLCVCVVSAVVTWELRFLLGTGRRRTSLYVEHLKFPKLFSRVSNKFWKRFLCVLMFDAILIRASCRKFERLREVWKTFLFNLWRCREYIRN